MRINTKIRYGLRTMVEIANAPEHKGILQKDIALNQGISLKYLDSIVLSLKQSGLIENVKGKGSGYVLCRSPQEISMLDIYLAFEKISFTPCVDDKSLCEKVFVCKANDFWCELNKDFEDLLRNKRLIDICKVP